MALDPRVRSTTPFRCGSQGNPRVNRGTPGAESLLTLTNIADVVGLKLTLDAALRGQGPMLAMLGAAASDGGGTQRTSDGGGEQRLEEGGGAGGGVSGDGGGGGVLGLGGVLGGVPLGVGFFGGFLAALAAGQAMA